MNYTVKLLIPLGLGLAAAVINIMALNARTQPVQFLKVTHDIRLGERFRQSDLAPLLIPGPEAANLKDSAMPFRNLGVIIGQEALRDFRTGDIVFFRDFEPWGSVLELRDGEVAQRLSLAGAEVSPATIRIGDELEFLIQLGDESPQWVGPFRVLSIGDRVANSFEPTSGGSSNTILVAVNRKPATAEQTRLELLDKFAMMQENNKAKLLNVRVSLKQ